MKEEITIKEIKEAKAELEQNLAKLVNDFEQKYDIVVYSVGFDAIQHYTDSGNYKSHSIRANVELKLEI